MRLLYSEDENFPGQLALVSANRMRSIRSPRGQAALRRLEAALVALPEHRLISNVLSEVDETRGTRQVCALGAVAIMEERPSLLDDDPDRDAVEVGHELGFPRLVAWAVAAMNDLQFSGHSPERRYESMLRWVRAELLEVVS
jgi:hypothetical protein